MPDLNISATGHSVHSDFFPKQLFQMKSFDANKARIIS